MASKTVVVFSDDLDGGTEGVASHRFALDGTEYEIDLSARNIALLRQALDPYIAAARLLKPPPRPRKTREYHRAVRAWWVAQQRPDLPAFTRKGRLPEAVERAYRAAH